MTEHEFHVQRRMFAVHDGELLLASPQDPRSHAEWLYSDHGVPEPGTRGYYDPTGLYIYGRDFAATGAVFNEVLPFLPALYSAFGCDASTPVWLGVVPQPTAGRWPGRRCLGPLMKLLARVHSPRSFGTYQGTMDDGTPGGPTYQCRPVAEARGENGAQVL